MSDTYKAGQWLALCQRCGFKHMSSQLKLEWTNLRVCDNCFEYRNPQDFTKGVKETPAPWQRPVNETPVGPFGYVVGGYSESSGPPDFLIYEEQTANG